MKRINYKKGDVVWINVKPDSSGFLIESSVRSGYVGPAKICFIWGDGLINVKIPFKTYISKWIYGSVDQHLKNVFTIREGQIKEIIK